MRFPWEDNFGVEVVTIDAIKILTEYPYVRVITFQDRLYKVVTASNRLYTVGERVLYVPDGCKLPESLLRNLGFWDDFRQKGLLYGANHNIVQPYYYATKKELFATGVIISMPDGRILDKDIQTLENTSYLAEELGITYLTRGKLITLEGEMFSCDVPVKTSEAFPYEASYTVFDAVDCLYQEYVSGRKFYVTVSRHKMYPMAFGKNKNVFIRSEDMEKYRFFSYTKHNRLLNLYCKWVEHYNIDTIIQRQLINNSTWRSCTLQLVLRNAALGNSSVHRKEQHHKLALINVVVTGDTGDVTLSPSETEVLANLCRIYTPKTYYTGNLIPEKVIALANQDNDRNYLNRVGVVIRNLENYFYAVQYSDLSRIKQALRLR
jgi:hypothetical protein